MNQIYQLKSMMLAIRTDLNELIHIIKALSTDNPQEAEELFKKHDKRVHINELVKAWKKRKDAA